MTYIAREDLTGKQFGRLTVIERDFERDNKLKAQGKKSHCVHWLCQCSCGNPQLRSIDTHSLISGHTQSCGCYHSEQVIKRNKNYSTKKNEVIDCGDTVVLLDEKGNRCLIDKEDYPIIKYWYWRKSPKRGDMDKGYWITNSKIDDKYDSHTLRLHQIIAHIKYGDYNHNEVVPDHLSRNTSDNRKCNILLKSNRDNSHNRGLSKVNESGKTGVSFSEDKQAWVSYISVNYEQIYLGSFSNKDDAIKARKDAEEQYGFTCDDVVAAYDIKVV